MTSSSISHSPHGPDWDQRLEDWRDGLADAAESQTIERHVASCSDCQDYLEALHHIDGALSSTLLTPTLSPEFDSKLWSRIDSGDNIQRVLAKQRAQEELQQQLAALNAGWRRKVALMIPGILGGIALAFLFASFVSGSALMTSFANALQQNLGTSMAQLVQTVVTGFLGGAIGLAMTHWVVPTSD
jgi:anti-sigma factor RsiW